MPLARLLLRTTELQSWKLLSTLRGTTLQQQMAKIQVNVDITSDVVCPWYVVSNSHLSKYDIAAMMQLR